MNGLDRVLAEIRASQTAISVDMLAARLRLPHDELDAMIGYWVHRGDLIVEDVGGCPSGACTRCPFSGRDGEGCAVASSPGRRLTVLRASPAPDDQRVEERPGW